MTPAPDDDTGDDTGLLPGPDGLLRCFWCHGAPDYLGYHDTEWGFPVQDDHRLFEKLCLEGFQSGLSWLTILRKRDGFRRAFADFDFERIARFPSSRVDALLEDAGIVRHRGKIASVLNNARRASELCKEAGSLAAYFQRFAPTRATRPPRLTRQALQALTRTPESVALAKDLKRRGFTFVGPTTVYAFMQAMGIVNDHLEGCVIRQPVETARRGSQADY